MPDDEVRGRSGHVAERTCAVTRETAPREALVRLVRSPEGEVVVDYRGTLPGRGVWIQARADVLESMGKVAPRIGAQLDARCDADAVRRQLREAVERADH